MRRNSNSFRVYQAAKKGLLNTIPTDQITKAALRFITRKDRSLLHWAAMHSQINLIPPSYLSVKLLLRGGNYSTPIVFAAMCGCLNQIPAPLLTQHTLFYGLRSGLCAFQAAVLMGYAGHIPKALLTPENFQKSGRLTTFEVVDASGDVNKIPLHILKACRLVKVRPDKTLEELLKPEIRRRLDEPTAPG